MGTAVGIQANQEKLIQKIDEAVQHGYKRIKLKVKPGHDIEPVRAVRRAFPDLPLMVDANSSYTLKDLDRLTELDHYNLLMIEQPLGHRDFVDHATLQEKLTTPLCLDESITSFEAAKTAISMNSCRIIAIKHSRVGGLSEAIRIHDYCKDRNVDVWAGGMVESGIGKAHNIALASFDRFVFPGDITASSNFWYEDLITPPIQIEDGKVNISEKAGIGYEINRTVLEKYTINKHEVSQS